MLTMSYKCVIVALSYLLSFVWLWGIRGDPCATGIYNRPAGLSLCEDKALSVLCKCLRVGVCVSQQAVLYRKICLWSWEILINYIWQPKQGAHSEIAGQEVLRTILILLLKFPCKMCASVLFCVLEWFQNTIVLVKTTKHIFLIQ